MLCRSRIPLLAGLVLSLLLGVAAAAPAGRAAEPPAFEARSANGRWRARIEPGGGPGGEPGDEATPPRVRVFRIPAHQEAWAVPLRGEAPAAAYVTDDGRRVITLDSPWAAAGAGRVAIYTPHGRLQQYSNAQAMGMPAAEPGAPQRGPAAGIEVLLEAPGEPALFGVWLPTERRWAAWDLGDGATVTGDPAALARLNDALRRKALAELAGGEPWAAWGEEVYWPLDVLAHQRRPRDRAHLERALADDRFTTIRITSYAGDRARTRYAAASGLRREADRLLAEWDGVTVATDADGEPVGAQLGAVRGSVRLPRVPRDLGVIHVMLVPAEAWLREGRPLPAQRLAVELRWSRPEGKTLDFRLGTVEPGAYRLAALWSEQTPEGGIPLMSATSGEWVAVGPVVEVRAGALTTAPPFGSGVSQPPAP